LNQRRFGKVGVHPFVPAPAKLLRDRCRRSGHDIAKAFLVGALGCAALTSCAVGPDYHSPEPPLPGSFAATSSLKAGNDHGADRPLQTTQWWRSLHDRELDLLVERAIAANPSLEIALDRLQQARAQEAVVIGAALPSAEASAGGGWGTGSDLARGRASQTLVSAENGNGLAHVVNITGFDAAWELDIFGRYRRAIESAQYDIDAAIAARNVVLISLIADVTRAYLDLRALQMQLAVLRKNIDVAQQYVDFVQERFNRGITNELDVTLAQRELAQLQAQVAPLIARIEAARYVIAVLIGVFPENLGNELKKAGTLPALPSRIRAGLPIDLLRRRPDVAEAERELASATALIGVATADLFPRVAVTAGAANQTAFTPLTIGPIWSVGPAFAIPLLDFGRLDAVVEKADYRARELLFAYKQKVLNAFREVDTAIDAYAAEQDRLRHLADAVVAAKRAVTLATERFDRGLIDSLNVIDAERQEYLIEQEYVLAQQSAAAQLVTLYKSLGSGWEDYQVFPPIRRPLPAAAAAIRSLLPPDSR
jgi:NodT family efflux transporter outer membrane factor (OMF) lipoprotein